MSSVTVGGEQVLVEPLGSGQEVGRSCVIVSHKGCKVMFDCGVHPAEKGINSLPYFPADCSDIDIVLITHFHLDHCAGLPFLCEQTNFRGRIFMTTATRSFYKICMNDFIRVGTSAADVATAEWVQSAMDRIETVEYHQEIVHNGIRFQPFNAGHVLGAAMFLVDIAGARILYTGDFSRTPDRHLLGAEIPPISPDVLIVESTYGTLVLETREEREAKFIRWVNEIVSRGGRCLIPVFALGRAQELLLILEEHWENNKRLQHIPIYYASSMASRSMRQYQTFVSGMNDWVREKHERNINPFDFKYIKPLRDSRSFQDNGPAVVLASPGMLQSGVSYELFERWCGNPNNGVIIAGYCVEGTLAREVLKKPPIIHTDTGKALHIRMSTIETVSFSAHSDGRQTKEFIHALQSTQHIVLVHGQETPMMRLKESLQQEFGPRGAQVYAPRNKETVAIPFASQRVAKVFGTLAKRVPAEGSFVNGVLLVSGGHKHSIVHPRDISSFTGLPTAAVHQAMVLPLPSYVSERQILDTLQSYFAQSSMFGDITPTAVAQRAGGDGAAQPQRASQAEDEGAASAVSRVHVAGSVHATISHDESAHTSVTISWTASNIDDLVADVACIALLQLLQASDDTTTTTGGAADVAFVDAPLPVEMNTVDSASDRAFRFKCFHHMLSQFYGAVQTDLRSGRCVIPCPIGNTDLAFVVEDCIKIKVVRGGAAGATVAVTAQDLTDHSAVIEAEVQRLGDILKRTYLTLFPIPIDAAWCDCGKFHFDDTK